LQHSLPRAGRLAKIRDLSVINSRSWHGCDSAAAQRSAFLAVLLADVVLPGIIRMRSLPASVNKE
jgi:hypothetical protein